MEKKKVSSIKISVAVLVMIIPVALGVLAAVVVRGVSAGWKMANDNFDNNEDFASQFSPSVKKGVSHEIPSHSNN